jgi:hypothetical protein
MAYQAQYEAPNGMLSEKVSSLALDETVSWLHDQLRLKDAEIEELKEQLQESKRLLRSFLNANEQTQNSVAATQRFLNANMD